MFILIFIYVCYILCASNVLSHQDWAGNQLVYKFTQNSQYIGDRFGSIAMCWGESNTDTIPFCIYVIPSHDGCVSVRGFYLNAQTFVYRSADKKEIYIKAGTWGGIGAKNVVGNYFNIEKVQVSDIHSNATELKHEVPAFYYNYQDLSSLANALGVSALNNSSLFRIKSGEVQSNQTVDVDCVNELLFVGVYIGCTLYWPFYLSTAVQRIAGDENPAFTVTKSAQSRVVHITAPSNYTVSYAYIGFTA